MAPRASRRPPSSSGLARRVRRDGSRTSGGTCGTRHGHSSEAKPAPIVEQILHLRRTYHLGPIRIVWYLERYHGIRVSDATVYRALRRGRKFPKLVLADSICAHTLLLPSFRPT